MIKRHEFNSDWWGTKVGIITDATFFSRPANEVRSGLGEYAWVEFIQPVSALPDRRRLVDLGFFYTDTQVRFRIELGHVQPASCANALQVESAVGSLFHLEPADLKPFPHERFYLLPGATEARVSQRYALWANNLIQQHPKSCLRFTHDGKLQGWFLSHGEGSSIELTLAMLSANATASGYDLYSRALAEYARMGFRLGSASFSVKNSPVHNIYANLGARFLEPKECWMWVRPED